MQEFPIILQKINTLQKEKDLILIGIDGRGGSGKTTTALLIKQDFPEAEVITTDDFWNESIHKIDETWLRDRLLQPLAQGKSATYSEYDGKKNNPRTVEPKGIVIVEGIYSTHSSIADHYDLTIWVSTEEIDDRVTKRDGHYDKDWELYHRPNEVIYIAADKPQERADFVIENSADEKLNDLGEMWKKITG